MSLGLHVPSLEVCICEPKRNIGSPESQKAVFEVKILSEPEEGLPEFGTAVGRLSVGGALQELQLRGIITVQLEGMVSLMCT